MTIRDQIEGIVNAIGEISKTEAMNAIDQILSEVSPPETASDTEKV